MHAQAEAMNRHDAMLHALTSKMKSLQDLISGHPGLLVKILTPKSVQLDFPRFDGEDRETWCCCTEEFFEFYHTPAEHSISISYYHMDGHAVRWYQELLASKKLTN